MHLSETIDDVRQAIRAARHAGDSIGFVPTMGALHEGHCSLIREARRQSDFVVVSIFVNPTQFSPSEDFGNYPRPIEADLAACRREQVDLVFQPNADEMYSSPPLTTIHVAGLTERLCGASRPGHFDGVTTVVAKLLYIVRCDRVFFGEKDFQQLAAVRRMVSDLNIDVEVVGCPTVRAADGLAYSSRNAYLTESQRRQAAVLFAAMREAAEAVAQGERRAELLVDQIKRQLSAVADSRIDYVEIVDAASLESVSLIDRHCRICLAVWIGKCRLIDNLAVDGTPTEP